MIVNKALASNPLNWLYVFLMFILVFTVADISYRFIKKD